MVRKKNNQNKNYSAGNIVSNFTANRVWGKKKNKLVKISPEKNIDRQNIAEKMYFDFKSPGWPGAGKRRAI